MIETSELHHRETAEVLSPVQPLHNEQDVDSHHVPGRTRLLRQVLRFGLVGGLNTLVDLLILNGLLLLFPTTSTPMLLAYNSLAYSLGAVNSFLLNKYWTFGHRQKTTRRELARFTLTTLCGIGWSTSIIWLASRVLRLFLVNTTMWANASKVLAILGTALISYLGMHLWVFVSKSQKELTLFMDADRQFNIRDLQQFFPFIDEYDAVIGYRMERQDSWMRKLNAWGWKRLVGWVLGVHVRDVDCAFKLLHTEFLRQHPLETRGAMINAELLYKLTRAGYSYGEIGVHHLPRLGRRATGARPSVILRALRELFVSARRGHREEQECTIPDIGRQRSTRSRA